jgi:P-type Cu2+ transporter
MAHAPTIDTAQTHHDLETLDVPIGRRCCSACVELVERRLREQPHVARVHVDAANGIAHVEAHTGVTSVAELTERVGECCGDRCPVLLPDATVSSHHHAHAALIKLEHGAAASEARSAEHAEHAGMSHAGHDMSDPRMAAAMEADMRRRFWISLVLSIPVVAYSGLGMLAIGDRELPTPFGSPADWIMLAFATPVALWTSSVFHVGAFYALKSRVLNMSVLVSLGILTSYLFSLGLTLFAPGQETFYEAAVMLAVFLLFGHWMEMKARRGSSDSVRKLLDLAPQTAAVEREGRQVELPVAEVHVGDVVVLKPGDGRRG